MQPLRNQLLVDELQLGNQLNNCVRQSHSATFGMLLAMLSQDVCDRPRLPGDDNKVSPTEEQLRQSLHLPPKPSLVQAAEAYCDRAVRLSRLLEQGFRNSVALEVNLTPEPLAQQDDRRALDDRVKANIGPLTLAKLQSPKDTALSSESVSLMDDVETQLHYVATAA